MLKRLICICLFLDFKGSWLLYQPGPRMNYTCQLTCTRKCQHTRAILTQCCFNAGPASKTLAKHYRRINSNKSDIFLYKPWIPKVFQFEIIIINVLFRSSRFIWIPVWWVYDHYRFFFSAMIDFRRQINVRFWRQKAIPALKGLTFTTIWTSVNVIAYTTHSHNIDPTLGECVMYYMPHLQI